MGRVALFACVVAVTLAGCAQKPIAIVNGTQITAEEFDGELRKDYGSIVLGKLVEERLIDDALVAGGIVLDPAKVEEYLQEYYESHGGEEMAMQEMQQQGQTPEDLLRGIENYLKVEMLGQKDLQYADEDLKAYYDENSLRYDEPAQVVFSRIMVMSEEEANEVYAKASQPDASFPDLAKEFSIPEDQFKLAGGRLPAMAEPDIPDIAVRDLLFKELKPGGVGKPLSSGGAWHVIKLDEKIAARTATFEDAKEKVEEDYQRENMVQFADVMQRLRSAAKVKIEDPMFAELQRLYIGSELLDAAPESPGAGIPEPITEEVPAPEAAPEADAPVEEAPAGEGD